MRHNCRHIVESQTKGCFFSLFSRRQLVGCQYSIDEISAFRLPLCVCVCGWLGLCVVHWQWVEPENQSISRGAESSQNIFALYSDRRTGTRGDDGDNNKHLTHLLSSATEWRLGLCVCFDSSLTSNNTLAWAPFSAEGDCGFFFSCKDINSAFKESMNSSRVSLKVTKGNNGRMKCANSRLQAFEFLT